MMLVLCGFSCCCFVLLYITYMVWYIYIYLTYIHPYLLTIPTWGPCYRQKQMDAYLLSVPWMQVHPSLAGYAFFLSTLISIHSLAVTSSGDLSWPPQVYLFWISIAHPGSPSQCLWLSGHCAKIICLLINSLARPCSLWGWGTYLLSL